MSRLTIEELRFSYKFVIDLYIDLYNYNEISNRENRILIEEFKFNSIKVSKSLYNRRFTSDMWLGSISDDLQKLMNIVKKIKSNINKTGGSTIMMPTSTFKKVTFSDSDPEDRNILDPFDNYPEQKRIPKKISQRVSKNVDSDTETETGNEIRNNDWIDLI